MKLDNFIDKYKRSNSEYGLGARFPTMYLALSLLHNSETPLPNIVETGTTRKHIHNCPSWEDRCGDGCSTVLFGDYVHHYGGHVWTCDIEQSHIDHCKIATQPYMEYITYCVSDSIKFLETFDQCIDLLYLDSVDGHTPFANEHQLSEIKTAWPKLTHQTIILLDDLESKTNLSIPFLQQNNYCQIVLDIPRPANHKRLCQGLFVHESFLYCL